MFSFGAIDDTQEILTIINSYYTKAQELYLSTGFPTTIGLVVCNHHLCKFVTCSSVLFNHLVII